MLTESEQQSEQDGVGSDADRENKEFSGILEASSIEEDEASTPSCEIELPLSDNLAPTCSRSSESGKNPWVLVFVGSP